MKKNDNFDALIIGVDSLIGSALYERLSNIGKHVIGTSRKLNAKHLFFDLTQLEKINELPLARHIFICAGVNGFKVCEENIDLAIKVNFYSTCRIAKHFMMLGSHVIFFSSSSVFGSNRIFPMEYEIVNPNTDYGRLKVLAEQQMSKDAKYSRDGKLTIVRLTKLIESLAPLIESWKKNAELGKNIQAYKDMYLCPISINFIINSVIKICENYIQGVIHLSGNQILSYYEFAKNLQINGVLENANINGVMSQNLTKPIKTQCISLGMGRARKFFS